MVSWSYPFQRTWNSRQHSLWHLARLRVHCCAMEAPPAFGVKLLITLVTLILITSWKVDTLHMLKRVLPFWADLATQVASELPKVFPFSDFSGVFVQILLNFSSVPLFQLVIEVILLLLLFKCRSWKCVLCFHFDFYWHCLTCIVIYRGRKLMHSFWGDLAIRPDHPWAILFFSIHTIF